MTTFAQFVLLWPFLALPILLLVHFGADSFGTNFMNIIFFCFFRFRIFQFFMYKNIFSFFHFFFFFFQKQSKIFS